MRHVFSSSIHPKCRMAETQFESVNLRPPEVGALFVGVISCIKASGFVRTNIEAISDMLKYTKEKPTMQTMKP